MEKRAIERMADAVRRWSTTRAAVAADLEPYALDPDQALDLLVEIATAEYSGSNWPISAARALDRLTVMHGMEPEVIAAMTGRSPDELQTMAKRSWRSPRSRDVLLLHREGFTPAEIAEQIGISKVLVYRWIADAGMQPHRRNASYPATTRGRAIELYRSGRTYSQIARSLRVPVGHVPNLLRSAHRRGELPEYGSRRAS